MSKKYIENMASAERYETKLKEAGIKLRHIRMSDTEYAALQAYKEDNNYSSLQSAIVSLIPEKYFKKD